VPNSSKLEIIVIFATFLVDLHIFRLEFGQSGAMGPSFRGIFQKNSAYIKKKYKKKKKKKKKEQKRHIFPKKNDGMVKLR
jgi:hypothetical protein